ncbi:MAG TPA: dihydroorotate dehydrogenase [Bryobacteraceae bacterium]|nr:dihydroorotate dehydrogenase [Bryobacteraceae bacterium]
MSLRLATSLCGIALRTPVLAASGTYAYGVELRGLADLGKVGGIVTKGLSRESMEGNPAPRLFETDAGMMNSVGLQNIGVKAFISDKLPAIRDLGTPVFCNVFGYAVEDYVEVIRALEDTEGIAGYELNVSCPNTAHGGMFFSNDPALLAEVVQAARQAIRRPSQAAQRPLIVKLSPNVARIEPLARAAADAGADAISLVNTFVALAIDPHTRKPRLGNGFGGLSGPAIKPIAVRMVYEAAQAVKIPVIGLGGIAAGADAAEFLIAGASVVEVGTASFWDPQAPVRVAEELDAFLAREGIARVQDLVGTIELSK